MSGIRYIVLAALCMAATLAYMARSALAVPASLIQTDLHLSDDQLGSAMGAFFLAYALCQLPAGWLGERLGTRFGLTLFLALSALATCGAAWATGFAALYACRLLTGAAQAGLFPCCVQTFSKWFPPIERSLPSGMLTACMSVGSVVATAAAGALLGQWHLDWQTTIFVLSAPGVVFALLFVAWFRNSPHEQPWVTAEEQQWIAGGETAAAPQQTVEHTALDGWLLWKTLLTSMPMWLVAGQQFFRAMAYVFFQTWCPTYLQKARGLSIETSAYATTLALVGVVLGSVAGGALADLIYRRTGSRRLSRKNLALAALVVSSGMYFAAGATSHLTLAMVLLTVGSLAAGMTSPLAYTLTIDMGGKNVGTVFSVMNMAGNIGGALCPTAVAWWVDLASWNTLLAFFGGVYLAGAACWWWLDVEGSVVARA